MEELLIQDDAILMQWCRRMQQQTWLALDTEFMRTRTYYARLCLVQVATPDFIVCVDTLAVSSIEPLLEVIYSSHTLPVLHAARQDLEVFADIRRAPPAQVFDTQIAATLCGHGEQLGYGALVELVTGHKLPKLHTRADWEQRPLPSDQLRYAADDVRYLRDVYEFFVNKLETLQRMDWMREECAALTNPSLYHNDPEEAYRRLKQGGALPLPAQMALRALAMWRETMAQQLNLPRGWIVSDAALIETAVVQPTTVEALNQVDGMAGPPSRKWGEAIVQTVQHALSLPPARLWEVPQRPDRQQQDLYERLQMRVQALADQHQISATLVAPKRELLKLIFGDETSCLTRGWRRALIGDELLSMRRDALGDKVPSEHHQGI